MNFWTDIMIPLDLATRLPIWVEPVEPVRPEPVVNQFEVILDVDAILQALTQFYFEVLEGFFLGF